MVHTHDITVTGDVVRKRYVAWDRGEAEREWAGLQLLAREAPGLAPALIGREVSDGRPVVVMSRVAGEPLGGLVSATQQEGLITALRTLFAAPVPAELEDRANGPEWMRRETIDWLAADLDLSPCADLELVLTASAEALEWLGTVRLPDVVDRVIALGDGNLDNVLWDNEVCRLIDWEEYGASDLTYELADLVEHASSRLTRSLDVDGLLARFDLTDLQSARLGQHRRLLGCNWLMKLLPANGGFARNPARSTEDQARHVLTLLG